MDHKLSMLQIFVMLVLVSGHGSNAVGMNSDLGANSWFSNWFTPQGDTRGGKTAPSRNSNVALQPSQGRMPHRAQHHIQYHPLDPQLQRHNLHRAHGPHPKVTEGWASSAHATSTAALDATKPPLASNSYIPVVSFTHPVNSGADLFVRYAPEQTQVKADKTKEAPTQKTQMTPASQREPRVNTTNDCKNQTANKTNLFDDFSLRNATLADGTTFRSCVELTDHAMCSKLVKSFTTQIGDWTLTGHANKGSDSVRSMCCKTCSALSIMPTPSTPPMGSGADYDQEAREADIDEGLDKMLGRVRNWRFRPGE